MNPRRWMALAIALSIGGMLLLATIFSAIAKEDASMFRAPTDGTTSLVQEAEAQQLEILRLLSGPQAFRAETHSTLPAKTLYVVVTPQRSYAADEVDALMEFAMDGGQLLVADNFGQANSLSAPFGITFERVRLVSGADAGAFDISLDGRTLSVQAKAPTALHFGPQASAPSILAYSASDSYLDRDGDGLVQAWEPKGPFAVVAEIPVGNAGGRIVAMADPGLLWVHEDDDYANEAFRQALIAYLLPDGGRIVIDESRDSTGDPILALTGAMVGAATGDPWRSILWTLSAALFSVGVLVTIHGLWGPHRFDLHRFIRRADIRSTEAQENEEKDRTEGNPLPGAHWTRRGMTAVFGGLLLILLGIGLGNLQATYAGSFLLLAAVLATWTKSANIEAQRVTTIDRVHEDSRTDMVLKVTATGRKGQEVEVLDRLPHEFELADGHNWFQTALRSKVNLSHTYSFRAALRGPYPVGPLRVRTTDAFGLRSMETEVGPAQRILVLPRNDPLSRIPFKSRIPVLTIGPHLVNRAGDGTEFHSLRDYQSGDSIRIVNWKASARSKNLVVNQRVHESKATLTIFLDARAITEAGHVRINPVNEGCRVAQSIATGGLQARDNVRIFVYGEGVEELCPMSGRGKGYQLSEALASVKSAGRTTFLEAVEESLHELHSGSPAILVSGMEGDTSILEGLKRLGQRSIPSTVIALQIGTSPESGEEMEPDADRLQAERDEMIAHIQGADVPVVPAVSGMPLGTLFQVALR